LISAALIREILMREGLDLLGDLYPHCFGRMNRRPLKVGVCEEVIAQHPEMSRHRIKRLLKEYTQHELYWSTLKAGTPGKRIRVASRAGDRQRPPPVK
jgi:sRNA-binding protein